MVWLLAFAITCIALATVLGRFERHLEKLARPWILDALSGKIKITKEPDRKLVENVCVHGSNVRHEPVPTSGNQSGNQ
jgi:hypothetical protein